MTQIELWGGLECTIARIGDRYRDQFAETAHHARLEDLDLVASLGIRTLRYPVLWEAVSPDIVEGRDWAWHDARLTRLRDLGIEPVIGLLHHGSGPRDTHLLDPSFPTRFAEHAREVAERYPWVRRFTPVNEPLTTARFSALYGHWYPHSRDHRNFLRAVVNQCSATIHAMAAIRQVSPDAELMQTEDIGRIFSTPALAYQASYENDRRWLSLDLLFGRLGPDHPFWPVLLEAGITEGELRLFEAARPPDLIGINHYLTSDRYLDEDLSSYPPTLHGGNGRQRFADVEAVRIAPLSEEVGPLPRIREVASRYGAPVAITEVHHGCSREEQLRWLHDVWRAAVSAREEGIDLRAVTIWSIFGALDWNSLLTREERHYEPGAFDVRGPKPRPTALAAAARSLAGSGQFDHPVLAIPGWWHRADRFYKPELAAPAISHRFAPAVALVGSPAPFRSECLRIARHRGVELELIPPGVRSDAAAAPKREIWAVLDASSFATTPSASNEVLLSWLELAARQELHFCLLSRSDVFAATSGRAALEEDAPSPTDNAGRRMAAREEAVLAHHPGALIARAGLLFGPGENRHLTPTLPAGGGEARSIGGRFSYIPDLIHAVFDLLLDGERGVRHLVSGEALDGRTGPARVPALGTAKGVIMPPLESALAREADRIAGQRGMVLQAAE